MVFQQQKKNRTQIQIHEYNIKKDIFSNSLNQIKNQFFSLICWFFTILSYFNSSLLSRFLTDKIVIFQYLLKKISDLLIFFFAWFFGLLKKFSFCPGAI